MSSSTAGILLRRWLYPQGVSFELEQQHLERNLSWSCPIYPQVYWIIQPMFPLIFLFSGLSWWCSGRITNILAKYFKCPFNQSPSSFSCSPFSREGQISLKTSHPCTYSNQPSCFLMMSICSGGGMVMVRAMWRRRRRGGVWSTHKEPVPHCHYHGSVCSGGGWSWRGRRCIDLISSCRAVQRKAKQLLPWLSWTWLLI